MNLNHLVLSGNLTRDPEVRTVGADRAVAVFCLAHNTRYKTADGEQREEVTFVDCEAWGRQGELAGQYLQKGSLAIVEGALRSADWTDKDGNKRTKLKLRVERLHFAPRGRADDAPTEPSSETGDPNEAPIARPAFAAAPKQSASRTAPPRPVARNHALTEAPPF